MENENKSENMEVDSDTSKLISTNMYNKNDSTEEEIERGNSDVSGLGFKNLNKIHNSNSFGLKSKLATKDSSNPKTIESINETNDSLNISNIDKKESKPIIQKKISHKNLNYLYNVEYFDEIFTNLLLDEQNLKSKIKKDYMIKQNDINDKMRAILVDWIIEVHYRYHFKRKTLYQTITIIDLYLSNKIISKIKLQLLGIASLLISCKDNEIHYPGTKEFIYITNNAYKKYDLLKMEIHVLEILNFEILSPSADEFYNILSKFFNFNKEQKFLGEYFMDSSLVDYNMLKYNPSIIAMACSYIVMKFYGINKYKDLFSSKIKIGDSSQKAIKECAKDLCFLVKNLSHSSLRATKKKYTLEQFGKVAKIINEKK